MGKLLHDGGSIPPDAPNKKKEEDMRQFIRIFTDPFKGMATFKVVLYVTYIVLSVLAYAILLGSEDCNPIVATCAFVNLLLCYYSLRHIDD